MDCKISEQTPFSSITKPKSGIVLKCSLVCISLLFWMCFFGSLSYADVSNGQLVVSAARSQVGVTLIYDPGYYSLEYPMGDIAIERGVCTDVVIRACREALGIDLQQCVHEDMTRNFDQYPSIWNLQKPDSNIDHRRVPNLQVYFKRHHVEIPVKDSLENFLPGDLVTCTVPPNLPHIMIISDKVSSDGTPLVLHNIGQGTREENRFTEFPITGHYRLKFRINPDIEK